MILVSTLLSGCTLYKSQHLTVWGICYDDRTILPNGMYETQEIRLRCHGGHTQVHFKYSIPVEPLPNPDPLDLKDKLKNFRGD